MLEPIFRQVSTSRFIPVGRWARWARDISDGHRRVVGKHRFAMMKFLRLATPIYLSSHRWELRAWSLIPQIKLAIAPVLRELGLKISTQNENASRDETFAARDVGAHLNLAVLNGRRPSDTRAANDELGSLTESIGAFVKQRIGTKNRAGIDSETQGYSGVLPLERIFRRVEPHNQSLGRDLLNSESRRLARRVTGRASRFEQYEYGPTVVRRQASSLKKSNADDDATNSDPRQTSISGWRTARPTPGSQFNLLPPDYSIEQLTEQVIKRIDDRVIAHKERMGKLF